MAAQSRSGEAGFTVAEMLVVVLIVGLVAALAVPSVQGALKRAEEAALRQNLAVMRRALDDHFADTATYPDTLEDLVSGRYLRFIPEDPTGPRGQGWALIEVSGGGIEDVKSRSEGTGRDGIPFREW
ncbi:MAG: prepilin-type N-terminal cleavage/methylation domain-containing protein [Pseudomonadota bacterium]